MINPDNRELIVTHDNEIAYVLSNFNEDFIYNTIMESLTMKIRFYDSLMPNIVRGYESMFKQILIEYPNNKEEILLKRTEVYTNILKILCDQYQLVYNDYDNYDLYTSVAYMYDLLVSSHQDIICNFFTRFIIKEQNSLYTSLNLAEMDKTKNIGNAYSNKVFNESAMGAICVNLDYVIKSVCLLDITFDQFIDGAFEEIPEAANHLKAVLSCKVDFVKTYITPLFDSEFSTALLTTIKLRLQKWFIKSSNRQNLFNKEDNK